MNDCKQLDSHFDSFPFFVAAYRFFLVIGHLAPDGRNGERPARNEGR
jgi:hypothetical protein